LGAITEDGDRFFNRFEEHVTAERSKHLIFILCEEFEDYLLIVLDGAPYFQASIVTCHYQTWKSHGIWPKSTPQDEGLHIQYGGPTPDDLEQAACTECGANVWRTRRGPYVAEYDTGAICGYCSYKCYFTHRNRNTLEEITGEQSVYIPSA
jgi:DNA-directed RNA polymerase subunit RPC12/RpoP